jgi:peptidase M1-like protein
MIAMATALLVSPPPALRAQSAPVAPAYADRFAEVMALSPAPDGVADVSNLVLQRDLARFTLKSGKLYLLTPIGGRTVAALFRGTGTFSFAPTSPVEQHRLARYENKTALEAPFTDVLLMFADTTMAELRTLTFRAEAAPGEVRDRVRDGLKYLSDEDSQTFDPDLMGALLNGDTTDLFYAHIRRQGADPLMFTLNPHEVEAVSLSGKATRWWAQDREILSQFPRQGPPRDPQRTGERTDPAEIRRYVMNVDLPQSGIGEIAFAADAKLEITASSAVGPWVAFELFDKLKVDSARWESGEPATVFKGKDSPYLWVRVGSRMQPGETRTLSISYHGDLIERTIDFFRIRTSVAWYPVSLEGRTLATFDLTFNTPDTYLLASVGERVDSARAGKVITTRWVTTGPIRNASFNLGLFKDYTLTESGMPPVTVMISEEAHKKLAREFHFAQQSKMRETVGGDVSKSLQFFQSVYGPTNIKHFYATEIPEFHGEAFPGMLHLSWVTFQKTDDQGGDEVFRAHEVAHQWWGIGVDYLTYHDRWLSEGFAEFSGLWYMQTVRHSNDKYFAMLRQYRSSIFLRKDVPGPISLGHRVQSSRDADLDDYGTIVYKKGAWVVHMLRMLTLDLKTMNEDRFTVMMQDFYKSYQGKRASTADFRRIVERHTGADMGWFFDEWVHGTALPTYRVAYRTEPMEDGQFRVRLQIQQEGVPDGFLMYVPVTLDLGKDRVARVRVKVTGPRTDIDLPPMPASPKAVRFNDLEGVLAEVKMVEWKN